MEHRPNRRRFPRTRIPTEVLLRCGGNGFRGIVRVLGEGGMYVDTINPTSNGVEMDIVIESGEPIHARCVSRHEELGIGMGVEFIDLPPADRTRIRELISQYV